MPHWLLITLAIACWIWALMQTRIFLVYQGRIDSPTTGLYRGGEPNVVMSAIAVRSAVTFSIFGFLLLLIAWPRVLTYVCGVWVCRAIVDVVLCWLGKGQYSVTVALLAKKGRRGHLLQESAKVIGNSVWFGVCIWLFGI